MITFHGIVVTPGMKSLYKGVYLSQKFKYMIIQRVRTYVRTPYDLDFSYRPGTIRHLQAKINKPPQSLSELEPAATVLAPFGHEIQSVC